MIDTKDFYKERIMNYLRQNNTESVAKKKLYAVCRSRHGSKNAFLAALKELRRDSSVHVNQKGVSLSGSSEKLYPAVIDRVNRTYGFARRNDGVDVFIRGSHLKGAMPGDEVYIKELPKNEWRGDSPEGVVKKFIRENFSEFSGTLAEIDGKLCVVPDTVSNMPMAVSKSDIRVRPGDKVIAAVICRGTSHADHRCRITAYCGDSRRAESSAEAVLYVNGIETEFPGDVLAEAREIGKRSVTDEEIYRRLDLRDKIIFTIDGADTKDIDDAVSVEKTDYGYLLGVHIADVSYYVKPGTALDEDAFNRGTSVYYADKVIPMLPKELSNGICSLNPNEDRLAFSCIVKLDRSGEIISYKFSKTAIRSRVKGVYSEINKILDAKENGTEIPPGISEKYSGLQDTIFTLQELAEILTENRMRRGAPQLRTVEPKFVIGEDGTCIDMYPAVQGKSELIIEELMLTANTCAARLAREREIPFVFRVHEDPSPKRIEELKELILRLGLPLPKFSEVKPQHLSDMLKSAEGKKCEELVNKAVLRSMAKATYKDEPLGHFGLVLKDYAHFTSPIRRYPDLAVHRILTDLCYNKIKPEDIIRRYAAFAKSAAEQSGRCELRAMQTERSCEDCYAAEYMHKHLGEEFEGIISGITEYGFYVRLHNAAEGLVRLDSIPGGIYEYDGHLNLLRNGYPAFTAGDKVRVVCANADVSLGRIDFLLRTD